MTGRVLQFTPPVSEERLRVLPGIGGPLAPITIIGMSLTGHPLIKVEAQLTAAHEVAVFVRAYLARRDREGRR